MIELMHQGVARCAILERRCDISVSHTMEPMALS
jgi:hypothetical protein